MKTKESLGIEEILVKQHYITADDLKKAQELSGDESALDTLVSQKKINQELLGQAMAEYYQIGYLDLNTLNINDSDLYSVPSHVVKANRAFVVTNDEKEITIATDTPAKVVKIKSIFSKLFPNKKLIISFASTEQVSEILKKFRRELQERIDKISPYEEDFATNLFDEIMSEALDAKASDIHFEPRPENIAVRFRIDGILNEMAILKTDLYENILNRIKVLANIRIDQHYRTQDGAIRYENKDEEIDLRISIIPILEGQKVVLRLLSNYTKNLSVENLGLSPENYELVKRAHQKTYGMILTTGPTGSGKTTSLYAILKALNTEMVNITTIEDPVEYRIQGVNQIQVDIANDITFAKGLRSIVRQDPNVILVGEIRDNETAEIAVNAALTGHLLLSTFHANDAGTAVPRLLDMGIEPFLLASTLNLIVAQRLVRKICDSCKQSVEYNQHEITHLLPTYKDIFGSKIPRLYKGKGCDRCNNTGYKGRVGIFELIYVTDEIQELILRSASSREIWQMAQQQGASSFFDDGLKKVLAAEVSLEELVRVAPAQIDSQHIYGKKKH